jgi:hypothetical protein
VPNIRKLKLFGFEERREIKASELEEWGDGVHSFSNELAQKEMDSESFQRKNINIFARR